MQAVATDYDYIIDLIDDLLDNKTHILPSEWAEQNRYLPPGVTPQPGPWRKNVAPYAVEILDQLSSQSLASEIVIAKGAQTCLTVSVAENIIGYTISEDPCAIMYVTADKEMAKDRMDLAIDRMIDNSNLREKISTQNISTKNTKNTGDTQLKKEFPGGFLLMASIGSANRGRSFSVKTLLLDEVDAAKDTLGRDGDPLKVFKARTDTYETSRKIYYISTPLIKHTSKIWPLYKKGDQRRFFVPCLECGKPQFLDWSRLKFEVDTNKRLIRDSVHYRCENCKAEWKNHDKVFFLENGVWKPTSTSKRHGLISYHVSALYSPVGFKSWETITEEWVEAQEARRVGDIKPLQVFINLNLGEPWEERGEVPKYELAMIRRNDYSYVSGAIPEEGPLFLTSGTDVHKNRIITEKVAWGADGKSWSQGYHTIEGSIYKEKTWERFEKYLLAEEYNRKSQKIPLVLSAIDCGYEQDIVFNFCSKFTCVIPVMGFPSQQIKRWKAPFRKQDLESYPGISRFDLDVYYLKNIIYRNLKLGPNENGEYPSGFSFFPVDYPEQFFRELTAEEKIKERDKYGHIRYFYKQIRSRANHALDCRVYALAALFIYAYDLLVDFHGQDAIKWVEFWSLMQQEFGKVDDSRT